MPRMFLNGTAMAGGVHHDLVGDSPLVAATRTAPKYRFYSVGDRHPAVEYVGAGGAAVEGEVYEMTYEQLRDVLLPGEPEGLELGVIELADGTASLSMLLRRPFGAHRSLVDISERGSWRAYREAG